MSALRLLSDQAGLHENSAWALLDENQHLLTQGFGVADLPPADEVLVIIPDECVSVLSVSLPRLSPKEVQAALPAAVEDQLMTAVESTDLVLLDHQPDGISIVAAWSIEFRDTLLSLAFLQNVRSLRVIAESWALPLPMRGTGLLLTDTHCIFRFPDGNTWSEALDGDDPPPMIERALRETNDVVQVFYAMGNLSGIPAWVTNLPNATQVGSPFDWRSAPIPAQPCLYQRRRLKLDSSTVVRHMRIPALLAGIWLIFELLTLGISWAALRGERSQLKAGQEKIAREILGSSEVLVDAELQVQRKLDSARINAGEFVRQDFLVLLTRLASEFPDTTQAISELRYENGQLILRFRDENTGVAWNKAALEAGLTASVESTTEGDRLIRIRP